MRQLLATSLAIVTLATAVTAPAPAQQPVAGPSSSVPADQADAFGERVRAYLLAHPEVIREAITILQNREQLAQVEATRQAITTRADEIFRDPASPVGGNSKGDVTLVEFFDYNCKYCRAVAPTMAEVSLNDPGLRIVYKEFPILGPGSEAAARVALAAARQGKYHELHQALMTVESPVTEEKAIGAADAAGLDLERLKRDLSDPAIAETIARNHALAAALGINGTPGFVIADQLVPGAIDRATMERMIADARDKPKATP